MSISKIHHRSALRPVFLLSLAASALLSACVADQPGLSSGGVAGSAGASQAGQAGADAPSAGRSAVGDGGEPQGGADAVELTGGNATGGNSSGGSPAGGNAAGGSIYENAAGGTPDDAGAQGNSGGVSGVKIGPTCPFHTDEILTSAGAGGVGGANAAGAAGAAGGPGGAGSAAGAGGAGGGGPALTVTLQTSPFVGAYLADATGRTLYTYGNDLPGDCHTPPVSNCVTDCLVSWPLFPAGARLLAPGLDDKAFGAILRADGLWQTTYFGWPLYYYKTDLTLGQVAGQGKSKTWHIAQQKLPGVQIMKPGAFKYLGDAAGHTLYVSSADQRGVGDVDPISTCSGSCLETFEPFHEKNFSVVTSLLMADFAAFLVPSTDTVQVAYKGQPLYRAATDLKSGDMNGLALSGFSAALP